MDWEVASQVGGAAGVVGAVVAALGFFQARGAVSEARRSADAAEASLKLQKDEATAAAEMRTDATLATVVPLGQQTRGRLTQGFEIQNYGPAIARNVVVAIRQGSNAYIAASRPALSRQDGKVTLGPPYLENWIPPDDAPSEEPEESFVSMRVRWDDGELGRDSGWQRVPRV